jgi:release factor glutamine methyltransferase
MAEKNISEIWNCKKIIDWGVEFFKTKNIDSPRLTIELLLCKVLQCQRIDLYTKYDIPLKDNELELLRELVKRRAKHEPLQYILGTCHFYESEFIVEPGVLIPRPETEILVDEVIKYVKTNVAFSNKKSINILEIGSGSGCIALSLAKEIKNSKIISIDISSQAIEIAKKNQNNLKIANVDFIQKDMFSLYYDENKSLFFV